MESKVVLASQNLQPEHLPCILRNPFYFFVEQVLRYGTMNFERFFSGPPCRKANHRQLAYAKPAAWSREKDGEWEQRRETRAQEMTDYRSINVVGSTAPKSWGAFSRIFQPCLAETPYILSKCAYWRSMVDHHALDGEALTSRVVRMKSLSWVHVFARVCLVPFPRRHHSYSG